MKILWLVNFTIPLLAKELDERIIVNEGWISGLAENIARIKNIELMICHPQQSENGYVKRKVKGITFIGFSEKTVGKYDAQLQKMFCKILVEMKPDIIHIMGTEFPHSFSMVEACKYLNLLNYTVVSIQGLISKCQYYVETEVPLAVRYKKTLYSIAKRDLTIHEIKRAFSRRAVYERRVIENVHHVIGRTEWDFACIKEIQLAVKYHYNNEILRSSFYNYNWRLDDCERYSIFFSQATYPLKGFHILIKALPLIKRYYPDVHVYVGGYCGLKYHRQRYKMTGYERYIYDLLISENVYNHVTFCGELQEEQMVERYLKAHVYVQASFMENSPNSLGEAMILGVPSVASYVGGVGSLVVPEEDCLIYQSDLPYMLAHQICRVMGDNKMALKLSENARTHALKLHDRQTIVKGLIDIYLSMLNKN